MQKFHNVDRTHLAPQDSATKKFYSIGTRTFRSINPTVGHLKQPKKSSVPTMPNLSNGFSNPVRSSWANSKFDPMTSPTKTISYFCFGFKTMAEKTYDLLIVANRIAQKGFKFSLMESHLCQKYFWLLAGMPGWHSMQEWAELLSFVLNKYL